jgi:hypothetical protein
MRKLGQGYIHLTRTQRRFSYDDMGQNMRSRLGRQTVVVLYALAMMLVGFANTSHAPASRSPSGVGAYLASGDAQKLNCYPGGGAPSHDAVRCCEACRLSTAPGLRAVPPTPVAYVLSVVTEFAIPPVSGEVADFSPENIRSRAPPALG